MKIARLIGILAVPLQKDKITDLELAERLEVSRRTILARESWKSLNRVLSILLAEKILC